MRRTVAVLTITCGLAAAVAGCGNTSVAPTTGNSVVDQVIDQRDIDAEPSGSPQQALLRFWRSAQFTDLTGFQASFAPSVFLGTAARDLPVLSTLLRAQRPKVLGTDRVGRTVTVFTSIQSRQPLGETRFTTTSTPQAFAMAQQNGRWKLLSYLFVTDTVQPTLDAIALRAKQQAAASGKGAGG